MDPLEQHLRAQRAGRQVHFWHEVRALLVKRYLPPRPASVVDVGAGAGTLGDILARDRPQVDYRYFEPIDSMADQLAERFGRDRRLDDLAGCDDADLIAMLDVIEHVADPSSLLGPVVAAARPGTVLVVTVPAMPWLWSSWDAALGHHRRYTKQSLRAEVERYDVDVVEVGYLFPELVVPALVRRLARARSQETSPRAEFPSLPPLLDRLALAIGLVSIRGRRVWPVGTSASVVLRRR